MDSSKYIYPSYLIIGERKCGTSSLYRYLLKHPQILPCKLKEPQFFSKAPSFIEKNIEEYFALFPQKELQQDLEFEWPELNEDGILYHETVRVKRKPGLKYYTGEASANVFSEVAPELLHQYLPNIKLLLLFRNPIERAFSHHRMFVRFQEEGRTLGFKVQDFETDMKKEIDWFKQGKMGEFLFPGVYIQQLKKWEAVYGKEAIKIFFAQDLNTPQKAQKIMNEILSFLNIPSHDFGDFLSKRFNKAPQEIIPKAAVELLQNFYAPYNTQLEKHLGIQLNWNSIA